MLTLKITFCLGFFGFALAGQGEVCFPFGQETNNEVPQTTQGRPGKVGPMGPPGPVGPQGDTGPLGVCSCDDEMEAVNNRLNQLEDFRQRVTASASPQNKISYCSVGLKDRRVADDDLTASLSHSPAYGPQYGRLDNQPGSGHYGCWVGGPPTPRKGEWIQVDLKTPTALYGVVTQGRPEGYQWIQTFKISYGTSTSNMVVVQDPSRKDKIFQGNTDANTYVFNTFQQPIVGRYFRLIVDTWHSYPSLRMEYLTC